tara:strand:+ start:55 stop:459 length:405 start_codon:yes stop_codon:yes gene_type:complete
MISLSNIQIPSNKKFGYFFTVIFFLVGIYFYLEGSYKIAYTLTLMGILFLITTLIKADLLFPLNKLWMRFGLLLGFIVSPIVMGFIFFGMFTPISFLMKLAGRDELRLCFKKKISHWILRGDSSLKTGTFKNQF